MIWATMTFLAGPGGHARFVVDGRATAPSTMFATIQPRLGAPGYSWIRVYFYATPIAAAERARAADGGIESISTRWAAVVQLTIDKDSTVWQMDLSVPGHTCTVAASDRDAKQGLQEVRFDGTRLRLRLRGVGSHVCDMKALGIPNQTFEWDVDIDTPVVVKAR
jgi:hypothetical protein